MNIKIAWAAAGILGGLLVSSHAQTSGGTTPDRYQMFATDRTVFRLDTETGQVSDYESGTILPGESPTGKALRYGYWQKIDERWILHDPAEEVRQAQMRP